MSFVETISFQTTMFFQRRDILSNLKERGKKALIAFVSNGFPAHVKIERASRKKSKVKYFGYGRRKVISFTFSLC